MSSRLSTVQSCLPPASECWINNSIMDCTCPRTRSNYQNRGIIAASWNNCSIRGNAYSQRLRISQGWGKRYKPTLKCLVFSSILHNYSWLHTDPSLLFLFPPVSHESLNWRKRKVLLKGTNYPEAPAGCSGILGHFSSLLITLTSTLRRLVLLPFPFYKPENRGSQLRNSARIHGLWPGLFLLFKAWAGDVV